MWKRSLLLAAAAAVVAVSLPAQPPPAAPQPTSAGLTVELTVLRHQNVQSFGNPEVQAVFDEMGKILQIVDGTGDVACSVAFKQKGNVGVFTGPNVIQTQSDFDAINNLGGASSKAYNIKVVAT